MWWELGACSLWCWAHSGGDEWLMSSTHQHLWHTDEGGSHSHHTHKHTHTHTHTHTAHSQHTLGTLTQHIRITLTLYTLPQHTPTTITVTSYPRFNYVVLECLCTRQIHTGTNLCHCASVLVRLTRVGVGSLCAYPQDILQVIC